jgi:hypothetical protein
MPSKALVIRDKAASRAAYDASCERFQKEIEACQTYEETRQLRNAALKGGRTFMYGKGSY